MMMHSRSRPLAVIAIGAKPRRGDHDEPDGDEGDEGDDGMSGEEAAAEDAMKAAKAGDTRGFADAMRDFVRICVASGKRGEYDDEKEDRRAR